MKYSEYRQLVDYCLKNDDREINYINQVMIPLIREVYGENCYVKIAEEDRKRHCGKKKNSFVCRKPDILIDFKDGVREGSLEEKVVIKVKSPTAAGRRKLMAAVRFFLRRKAKAVIVTDCITWEIFTKDRHQILCDSFSLEKNYEAVMFKGSSNIFSKSMIKSYVREYPAKVGERIENTAVNWCDESSGVYNKILTMFGGLK